MTKNTSKNFRFSTQTPIQVTTTLFTICLLWEVAVMYFIGKLNISNPFLENIVDAGLLSVLASTSFWFVYFRPRWRNERKEQFFLEQQVKNLDALTIISITDHKGNIVYANDNFCQISGFSRDELLGKNHRIVNSGYHDKSFFENIWKIINKGETWQGQVKNKKKSGEEYWVYANIAPLRNEETKKIEKFISIRFDITKEKKLEEQLEQEQAKNIHMGRLAALGEMASSVAHEVNNPMAIITGKLYLIGRVLEKAEDNQIKESVLKHLGAIGEQTTRITKIVNGLKEFSHGEQTESPEKVDSTKLFEAIIELCSDKIKSSNVKVNLSIEETFFMASKLQLEQVLVNLVNNSIDAISTLNEKWIELSLVEKNNYIYVSIVDSGRGIPSEVVNKIMQPFFTTKPIGKGTGLGLSISKGIIEKHGGHFKYDPTSDNTKFIISFPKNEDVIFNSLNCLEAIEWIKNAKNKLDLCLKNINDENMDEIILALNETNSSLKAWIDMFNVRLAKNRDYLELKEAYSEFTRVASEIAFKIKNKSSIDINEYLLEGSKFNRATSRLIDQISKMNANKATSIEGSQREAA